MQSFDPRFWIVSALIVFGSFHSSTSRSRVSGGATPPPATFHNEQGTFFGIERP
jgi:hypothetical protein